MDHLLHSRPVCNVCLYRHGAAAPGLELADDLLGGFGMVEVIDAYTAAFLPQFQGDGPADSPGTRR